MTTCNEGLSNPQNWSPQVKFNTSLYATRPINCMEMRDTYGNTRIMINVVKFLAKHEETRINMYRMCCRNPAPPRENILLMMRKNYDVLVLQNTMLKEV
jgi:hypothetical protein